MKLAFSSFNLTWVLSELTFMWSLLHWGHIIKFHHYYSHQALASTIRPGLIATFSHNIFIMNKNGLLSTRVAASERNSVGIPLIWRRRNQFCDLVPIRRIESKSYFEIPFQSDSSSVFDLFFYAVQCVIYFCNLFYIIEHIK